MAPTYGQLPHFRVTSLAFDHGAESEVCHVLKENPCAEANARLIAKAPDLYHQLEIAVRFFEENGGDSEYSFLKEMRQTLAKARGE